MPIGPAAISLLTGAPMLATALYLTRAAGPRARIRPVSAGDWTSSKLDEDFIEAAHILTQSMADQLAEGIATHPQHWHVCCNRYSSPTSIRRRRQ